MGWEQVRALEQQDPAAFEELSLKRRWSSVCRDPDRGLAAERANTTIAPWPLINHMSPKQVQAIVNKKILKLDQASCKHILECMLEEKREEELKHTKQQLDKEKLRLHLKERHEKSLMLEQKCVVKNSSGRSTTSMHLMSTQPISNLKQSMTGGTAGGMAENGKDPTVQQKSVMLPQDRKSVV